MTLSASTPPAPADLRLRNVRRTVGTVLAVVVLIGGTFYWLDVRKKTAITQRQERPKAHVILRPGEESQDWRLKEGARVEELAKTVQKQLDQIDGLRGEMESMRKQQALERDATRKSGPRRDGSPSGKIPPIPPLEDILRAPDAPLPSLRGSSKPEKPPAPIARPAPKVTTEDAEAEEVPKITVKPTKPAPPPPAPARVAKPLPATPAQGAGRLRVITPRTDVRGATKDAQTVGWLPSGSFIHGSLLSGVDAGTGTGKSLPYPVLIRLSDPGILPNRFRMDLAECFVIGAAFGDLPSERVYIRTETLSCLRKGGQIITIDGDLKGHAIGEDGKLGLRGRVVSKEGTIIARSLLAGFLSGLGQAFRPQITFSPLQLGGPATGQEFQPPPLMDTLQAAGISGVGKTMDLLARHYLQQAQAIYPVIEIDAGRQVDLVVLKGMPLKFNVQRASGAGGGPEVID